MNGNCNKCGHEIEQERINRFFEKGKIAKYCNRCNKKLMQKFQRQERDRDMRDIGMVKVKGNLGGTYWE